MDTDVLIVGAGPAGIGLAVRLARMQPDTRVLVLDRYSFPRDKPCGGALTGHMGPVLAEIGLEVRVPKVNCGKAMVRYGSFERQVTMGQAVQVIRRKEFDADLVAQAKDLGIEVVCDEALVSYQRDAEGVTVKTSKGVRRCKILVGADGAASRVRKTILRGAKEIPHRLFMAQINVPRPAALRDTMTYDFSLMRRGLRGYLWVFPAPDDTVNVGLMHYPNKRHPLGGRELTELLQEGLDDYGLVLPKSGVRGWPVWGYHPKASISEERVLTIGDAAGIDGLTGEGIAVAMEQALVAAEHIGGALRSGDFEFRGYRKAVRKAVVGRELALDRWLSRLLYGGKSYKDWLALVLLDERVLSMYASRVDGSEILADQKPALYAALARHARKRRRRLRELDSCSN